MQSVMMRVALWTSTFVWAKWIAASQNATIVAAASASNWLIKEWELRIAYDSSGLLRAVLKAYHAHQEIEHSELEIGTA